MYMHMRLLRDTMIKKIVNNFKSSALILKKKFWIFLKIYSLWLYTDTNVHEIRRAL